MKRNELIWEHILQVGGSPEKFTNSRLGSWLPMYYQVLNTGVCCVPFLLSAASRLVLTGWDPKWWVVTVAFLLVSWEPASWLLNNQFPVGKHLSVLDKSYCILVPAGSCFSPCVRASVIIHKPELFG